MKDKKHKITVAHLDTEKGFRGGENQIRFLLEGLKNDDDIENVFIGQPDGKAIERFNNICKCIPLKMSGGVDVRAALRLKKLAKEYKIDIVDAHSGNAHSIALLAKICGAGFKLIVHRRVDNVPSNNFINRFKYLSHHISKYVCISGAISKIISSFGVDVDKIETVKSAVDSRFYDENNHLKEKFKNIFSQAYRLPLEKKWVCCAAAFTEQKGYDTLIRAWSLIEPRLKENNALVIAGDGELLGASKELCNELKMQDDIHFLGWIDNAPELLIASDVFAMSSNWEGLGTILLEASFAKLALCSTEVGGIPEVVVRNKTGLLSNVKDAVEFAKNLTDILTNEHLIKEFGDNAYKHAKEKFSLETMIAGNKSIYLKLFQECKSV